MKLGCPKKLFQSSKRKWGGQFGNLRRPLGVRSEGSGWGNGETPAFRHARPPFLTSCLVGPGTGTPFPNWPQGQSHPGQHFHPHQLVFLSCVRTQGATLNTKDTGLFLYCLLLSVLLSRHSHIHGILRKVMDHQVKG